MIWFLPWCMSLVFHCAATLRVAWLRWEKPGVRTATIANGVLLAINLSLLVVTHSVLSRCHPTAQFNSHSEQANAAWMTWMSLWPKLSGVLLALTFASAMTTIIVAMTVRTRLILIPSLLAIASAILGLWFLGIASPRA